jgi:hypothetical protein
MTTKHVAVEDPWTDWPVTDESIARAKAAAKREREELERICGVRVLDDGEIVPLIPADEQERAS